MMKIVNGFYIYLSIHFLLRSADYELQVLNTHPLLKEECPTFISNVMGAVFISTMQL